ncbi:hypothetical protein J4457_00590 [Candidatus Woesearchaeota archaeon]|nr:hypothetical protein [Candidatus Woesearchaeota archaeon]
MVIKTIIKVDKFIDLILVLGLVFYAFYSQTGGAECNAGRPDCGGDGYCGLDLKCHKFPIKEVLEEKSIQESKQAILFPFTISVALVIGAYFYRKHDKK